MLKYKRLAVLKFEKFYYNWTDIVVKRNVKNFFQMDFIFTWIILLLFFTNTGTLVF